MTEEKRTLIETFLPVDEITEEAKIEKIGAARPPISSMHYWWTRKPLITARAAVLGAVLPSDYKINDFIHLLGLNSSGRAHEYDLSSEQIEQLKKIFVRHGGELPIIYDPFAGGGSIPFEAMRVGLNSYASDYNPVAYLIERATLEYPQKYGENLHKEVKFGLKKIVEKTKSDLESYYPKYEGKDVAAYLWCWTAKCPKCGFENPLVSQWWLVNKDKKKIFLEPSVKNGSLSLSINDGDNVPEPTCTGGIGRCINCGSSIPNDVVKREIFEKEKDTLLALVLLGKHGYEYVLPSKQDLDVIILAQSKINNEWDEWVNQDIIPLDEIPDDSRGSLSIKNYLTYWHRLLNPRQKLEFVTLLKNIRLYGEEISSKTEGDYSRAIVTYLAFLLGKHIDYNCRSATLNRQRIMAHALTSRGLGMAWDHAEVNPFVDSCGSLIAMSSNILEGLDYSIKKLANKGECTVSLKSITQLSDKISLIITDPPYLDDVRYAEFSQFFFVWEQKALKGYYDFNKNSSAEEMSVGGWGRTNEFFYKLFSIACKKMNEQLTDDGLLVMFFAHSSIEAWDFVINSLQKNGFRITATWPLHTESTSNPIARGNASIMSSIIIVARKRKSEKSGYIEEIQEDVRAHLMKRLDEFWNYGLRGADLTVSAMGATLDIITQYSNIKSFTGEMQIKDVLELVQKYVAQYVLDRYMKNASGLDAATSFYLYTRLSQLEKMPFDTANLIAKSMNIDLKLFEKLGVIKTNKKGKAKGVVLLNYTNREVNTKQSLIDCVQFVMATFTKGGYTEVERELSSIPFSRNEMKDVLEALTSLPTEDPERQVAQKILERMGQSFPKQGQTGLDNF